MKEYNVTDISDFMGVGVSMVAAAYTKPQVSTTKWFIVDIKRKKRNSLTYWVCDRAYTAKPRFGRLQSMP